jgi:hypothetical protein
MQNSKIVGFLSVFALFVLLFLTTKSYHIIDSKPLSIHAWRQSDCAAQAINYYQNGVGLFEPQTMTHTGKDGHAASEFPILYYVTGKLYHLFGVHEAILRSINLLFFVVGLYFLFLLCKRFLYDNLLLAMFPVVIMATAPFYYYYANNFLPNVPAISLSLMAWHYFVRYLDTAKIKYFAVVAAAMTLAGLLKISDIISLVAMLGLLGLVLIDRLDLPDGAKTDTLKPLIKRQLLPQMGLLAFTFGTNAAWYLYARAFNAANHTGQNLLGIYPIWDMPKSAIKYTLHQMTTFWVNSYQHPVIVVAMLLGTILLFAKWRTMHHFLRITTLLLLLGCVMYSILWFKAFDVHDYYVLTNVIYFPFIALTVTEYAQRKSWFATTKIKYVAWGIVAILATIGVWNNARVQQFRYFKIKPPVNPALMEIQPYLRAIGIKRTDIVVSVPDNSPNTSLYYMNNPGFTECFNADDYNIWWFRSGEGAKYLIINDAAYLQKPLYQPFLRKKIGEYKGVYVFDIRE